MGYCTYMTRAGYELQAKLFAEGGNFHVTRVEVGRGVYPEGTDCSAVTGLADAAARATSTMPVRKGGEVSLTVEYRSDLNGGLEEAFLITEFGLFAVGAEGREELILYGDISDYPETAVPQKYGGCVRQYPVSIVIGPNAGASLGYPAGAWMTAQDVADALDGILRAIMMGDVALPLAVETGETLLTNSGTPIHAVYNVRQEGCGCNR